MRNNWRYDASVIPNTIVGITLLNRLYPDARSMEQQGRATDAAWLSGDDEAFLRLLYHTIYEYRRSQLSLPP